ncbi:MAG: L,D-transpeptidase [Segniliparus sp.]|uniref:L,D-transpeptidase n=1 Tax=Segniliparus sp. TaxID=2804064 RepID=UPI003F2DCB1E
MPEAVWPARHTGTPWLSRSVALAAVFGLMLGSVSCGTEQRRANAAAGVGANSADEALRPGLDSSVKDGATGVSPADPVTLAANGGAIVSATLTGADGTTVKTELSGDKRTWHSVEPLGYGKKYVLKAEVMGTSGTSTLTRTFTTSSPKALTMPYFNKGNANGEVVGVAQPVGVKFDEPISDRAAAEKAIKVTTEPAVEGAFYWISPTEVRWRPEHFWKPGTKVSVEVKDYGVNLGNGLFGQQDIATSFAIGDEFLAVADDNTKQIQIFVNGDLVRTMPTSMGLDNPKLLTNNGYYTVGDHNQSMIMDSSTFGLPTWAPMGYRTKVEWATQISYSGIYVHAAPWSVWAQGKRNTSHGCLNVSPEDGKWFLEHSKRGDAVLVKNTKGTMLPGNDGLGDWNIPWEVWKAGNRSTS